MSATAPHAGVVISHYRLADRLGAGGMGEVYAGVDEVLKRRVALKAIRAEQRLDPDAKARFLREARILSQLDHPHICRVYDYIEADDRAWLVLELIDGETLQQRLARGLAAAEPLRIAEQIASVLVATHAAGVVHRDLKPGNVMLTRAGEVKVLDFGLSATRAADSGAAAAVSVGVDPAVPLDETRLPTRAERDRSASPSPHIVDVSQIHSIAGTVMGTVSYMSPEQARGDTATTASDMYAFGLLLQELLTGRPARRKASDYGEALEEARRGDTLPPAGVGGELAALITRLKAVPPSERPTAVDALARLQWIRDAPRRRLRALLIAAAVAVLAVGAAKYTVDLSRERTQAIEARDEAARRRDQAEDLIGFVLGDLRTRLQQVGRLDLLDDVGGRAMQYFAAVPAHELSVEELARRSQALHQLGQIRQARGDLPSALTAYRESLQLAADVAARDPQQSEWQMSLATAHFYVGDALRRQADLDGAMREFGAYRDIAQRLVDRLPDDERWLLELSYARGSVAAVHEARGDLAAARSELESALALKRILALRAPDDVERIKAVATGHNRLGVVLERLGDSARALEHHAADLEIRRALVARNPADRSIKRNLTVAHAYVGGVHENHGNLGAAREHFDAWREIAAAQAAADPENADWARDLGRAHTRLAVLAHLREQLGEAEAGLERALAILRPIAARAATDAIRQRDVAGAELALGQVRLARGDAQAALAHAAEVERRLASAIARPGDDEAARLVAEARLLAGDARARVDDAREARRAREQAHALLAPSAARLSDGRALATWARVLLALDRGDEARPIVERLLASGYRHPTLLRAWSPAARRP